MTNKDYMKQAPAQTQSRQPGMEQQMHPCLLYTSDAADE